MNKHNLISLAINQIGLEYFTQCIKAGATEEEAKAEMLTGEAQKIIAIRIKNLILA